MTKKSQKARAAAKKARETTKMEKRTFHASNAMIQKAIDGGPIGMLDVKHHSSGLLDVDLSEQDPRAVIVTRNAEQSPLLRLPAEIRNKIFRMVVGDQQVTIDVVLMPSLQAPFILTCRQVYSEVGLLPYSANEFCFNSAQALEAWLNARLPVQRQAVATVWIESKYSGKSMLLSLALLFEFSEHLVHGLLGWTEVETKPEADRLRVRYRRN